MATRLGSDEINPGTEEEVANKDRLPDDQEYYRLPSNIFEAKQMNDDLMQGKINHERAINMVKNSLTAQRSCNEAIIFTYGLTGAGKTSTLNHIFGMDEIIIKKHRQADTTLISEYIATMKSDKWKVKDLEIGFIDVPGWNDTRKGGQDAINMANIDYFIKSHPYLGCKNFKIYPSIILVAIDTTNKRSGGSDNGSLYAMIHNLSKLRIVDKKRPNVLFVLTNVHSIARGEYKDTIKEIETWLNTLSNEILGIKPEIVHIENKWKAHELDKKGEDWTVLRDGTPQPINVLEAMMTMTRRCKDEVGQEAIRIFVKSRGTNHPKCRRKSDPTALSVDSVRKWKNELASQFIALSSNEVNNALFDYANTQIDTYGDSDILNRLILEMEKRKITKLKQLQSKTLNQIKELLTPYEIDEIESKALMKVCGVIPFDIPQIIETIGHGINTEQEIITKSNLIQLIADESHVMANLKVPKCMEAVVPIETMCVLLKENNNEAHTGCVKYQFQISQSVRCIRLLFNQQQLIPLLSPAFKEAVTALPDSSVVEESQQVREEYQHFFNTYGHFVIVACECGGVVQGDVQLMEKDSNDQQLELIKSFLYNLIDRLETDEEDLPLGFEGQDHGLGDIQDRIRISQLSWSGGKQMRGELNLDNLTHRDWIQWVDSLMEDPIPLDTQQLSNGKAAPVFQFVNLLDKSKSAQVRLAHETLDASPFNIFPKNTRGLDWENASNNLLPENAFKDPFVDYDFIESIEKFSTVNISKTLDKLQIGRGFPGTSKVIKFEENQENSLIKIEDLQTGDRLLHRTNKCKKKFIQVEKIEKQTGSFRYRYIVHTLGESKIGMHKMIMKCSANNLTQSLVKVESLIPGDTIFCSHQNKIMKSNVEATGESISPNKYSIEVKGTSLLLVDNVYLGEEEDTCFPGNASVTLKGGEKVRMDEVKIGDYVLSIHPSTGKPVYSKVYLWAHRDPHVTATFLHITHPHGHLHISANHLILSGEQRRPVPAGHLAVGDTIHSLLSPAATATATAISVPVLHIHTCTQVGYYAPFTNNGLIVVDGIASSVYSQPSTRSHAHVCASVTGGLVEQFGLHRVGECVMTPVRVGCKLGVGSLILTKQMDTTTHIHKYCQWLMKIY